MPNLRDWIEAQLKKGYSISQIKAVLNRKRYSPKAVAEVDKVRLSALPKKQIPQNLHSKKFILASLLIVAVLAAWFLAIPFFSKQPSENVIAEQKFNGQIRKDKVQTPVSEEERKLKEIEDMERTGKGIELAKEFNNDFCNSLLPKNIRSMQVNEYISSYHIDGSQGKNVKWIASEQPPAEFSYGETPKLFFVSSGNEFEGCGYKQEINNNEKIAFIQSSFDFLICRDKRIYLDKTSKKLHSEFEILVIESENLISSLTIFTRLDYTAENQILSSLGCI